MSTIYDSGQANRGEGFRVVITGWGIHLPNLAVGELVPGFAANVDCSADRVEEILGRKGLLSLEASTRLALCSVHKALGLRPMTPRRKGSPDPATAVVASSNLCNVQTVHKMVRTLERSSGRDISVIEAPNASSNTIASTTAKWFRFGGPNLMVCSGTTSGMDAVRLARTLLLSRRADRVVIVGAEPDDEVAARLYNGRKPKADRIRCDLRAGAAAVIIEYVRGPHEGFPLLGCVQSTLPSKAQIQHSSVVVGPREVTANAKRLIDLTRLVGDTYGAQGILQLAVAAAWIATNSQEAMPAVLICGDSVGGWRSVLISMSGNLTDCSYRR